jgi:hypothetical protein
MNKDKKRLYTVDEMRSAFIHGQGNGRDNEAGLDRLQSFEEFITYHNMIVKTLSKEKEEICTCSNGGTWLDGYYDTHCSVCKKHLP